VITDLQADDDPGRCVVEAVKRTLELAQTWLAWDGRPRVSEDGDRVYTPHKAIRRMADHLVDHIAEIEALLSGVQTIPDQWRGSLVTLESDWAKFSEADLNEAQQRLNRLGSVLALQLAVAGSEEWDRPRGQNMTLRQIAEHVGSAWYAEQVGNLSSD